VEFSSPDYSSEWVAGVEYQLQWSPDSSLFGSQVAFSLIYLNRQISVLKSNTSNDGKNSVTLPAGLSTDNDGNYNWQIPSTLNPSINYLIRVTHAISAKVYGESGVFAIN